MSRSSLLLTHIIWEGGPYWCKIILWQFQPLFVAYWWLSPLLFCTFFIALLSPGKLNISCQCFSYLLLHISFYRLIHQWIHYGDYYYMNLSEVTFLYLTLYLDKSIIPINLLMPCLINPRYRYLVASRKLVWYHNILCLTILFPFFISS